MRSSISNNLNSMDFVSISNRDLNLLSNMKVSQRLDSRLKSVMPQLKGKTSQIYLTIKAHGSFQDSKTYLIKQIKQQLQIQNPNENGQINLNNYITWSTFQQTKQLLKDQYLDNQLYYIIVPQKHLTWAQTFARQQRNDSQNKKKIHVLGILKDNLYKQKIKAQAKKRYDKIPDYIHYYSIDNIDCSREIYMLINQHLQQKIKHQDDHIKTWALSNKYADKKIQRKTIHIYFDQADKDTLQNLYRKYNPKSRSSWLQIHPYSSFYDIVKSIKQRQTLNIKQADKAQQMKQQLTSRLLQSKSVLDFGSMKSLAMLDNSQLISTSLQSVSKLNKDDVNIIISRTDFPQLDKLKAFVKAQKIKNWDLIQINTDSPYFYQKMAEIFQVGKNFEKQYQQQKQKKIINSKTLYIIAEINDEFTKSLFQRQDNIFHNMELLLYSSVIDFALLIRQGVISKDNYTVAVVPGGVNTVDYQFQKEIKQFMKQYKNTQAIQNFTFLSSANGHHASLISGSFQNDSNQSRMFHLANNDDNWLQTIMIQRDNFFHPFKGLKGSNVYILVKSSREYLLKQIRDYISHSKRLHLGTYIDKEYLTKQLQTIQIKDSAIVITDDQCLREAQEVLVNFDQVFIMNITNRKNLKEEVKVFAWGEKQIIYDLLKLIPELDEKFQSQTYIENGNKVSLERKNRFLPKKIQFIPGNTIVVRLPADLTDQQSRKMQVRLKRYFKQQIKFQYYKDPSDIRLRMKQIQPLTFNILRQKQLEYMKAFAKRSIQQKREQFILYHNKPEQYRYLIQKPQFQRFRFLSNSWSDIQDYIIRTYNIYVKPDTKQPIYQDQLIHIFVDKVPCQISQIIQKQIDLSQLKAANNTRFYQKSYLEQVMLMYGRGHKYYFVIEETFTENDAIEKKKQAEAALQRTKMIDSDKKLEFIHIGVNRGNYKNSPVVLKCIQPDYKTTVEWISSIKVLKVQPLNSRPYILIDKGSSDWYYFLQKYSSFTNKFRFLYTKSKQDMRRTIQKIRNKQPAEQIWILVKNQNQTNQCIKIAQKIQSGRNISILVHGNQIIKTQDQKKKVIFAHNDRLEVEKFILNPFRRSYYDFFPSSVNNKKVILAPVNVKNKSYENIPLNQRQISNWRRQLNAQIINCGDIRNLQLLHLENPDTTIYAIIDSQTQQLNSKKLQSLPNIKRIILNISSTYNPRQLQNNFLSSNKQLYQASYPAQITTYLKYLRYNIKTPQISLIPSYQKQLTSIYCLKSFQILNNDKKIFDYLMNKNDSILKYKVFTEKDMKNVLDEAEKYDYNVLFIGDSYVEKQVNDRNKKNNTKFSFVSVTDLNMNNMNNQNNMNNYNYNNNINGNMLLANSNPNLSSQLTTSQLDQLKMYIYNLPQTRYNKIKQHKGKFKFFYNSQNLNPQYLSSIQQLKKTSLRNNSIQIKSYEDITKINLLQLKQPCFMFIQAKDQANYQNLLKKNNNVQYLILNSKNYGLNSQSYKEKYLGSYGNKFFINNKKQQYTRFFNNLIENYGGSIQPLPLMIDRNITNILRSVENLQSQTLIHQKYYNLALNPPFKQENIAIPLLKQPLKVSNSLLDKNEPNLLNIPVAIPARQSQALGLRWIQRIKQHKITQKTVPNLIAPALDYPSFIPKPTTQPLPIHPLFLSSAPTCPTPPIKRFHLCVLFINTPQFKSYGQMIKSNLQPQQYTVKLISFRNQHELDEYSKGNASKLNSYDKIIVLLTPEYKKYQYILKTMKQKLQPRMEYFIFDDKFHQENHKLLAGHLKPYKIRKIKLPYQNPNLPVFFNQSKKYNIFTPYNISGKYQSLKNEFIQPISYTQKQQIYPYLHKYQRFNIIICDKLNYHSMKQLVKLSPRCILLIDDTNDLFEDQMLFYKIPQNCIYYGNNGNEYLKRIIKLGQLNNNHNIMVRSVNHINTQPVKMLYYTKNDIQALNLYNDYQKVQCRNNNDILQYMFKYYRQPSQYVHYLLKNGQIISIQPKVYMEDKQYMKDFKNNYIEGGYKHKNDDVNNNNNNNKMTNSNSRNKMTNSNNRNNQINNNNLINSHQFSHLQQVYYPDHKHLSSLLQSQQHPCIILINGSNNRMLWVKSKYSSRHKFISIINDNQRWIDRDGYLLQVQDYKLRKKQDLFLSIFNEKIFQKFNDFQYYYLSNKADEDHRKNIYFRTKEDLQEIYQKNHNLLMVVFVQSNDRKHIPQIILQQSYKQNGRVKIIYLHPQFLDSNDSQLYIKYNQIDPVIIHINRVQLSGRKDYILFKQIDGDKKRRAIIMQRHLQNLQSKHFNTMDDIEQISQQIKGQYKKIYVICYPYQHPEIQKIFQKYSIKNKEYSNEEVQFFYIDQVSTIHGVMSNINSRQSYINQNISNNHNQSNNNNLVNNNQVNNLLLSSENKKKQLKSNKAISNSSRHTIQRQRQRKQTPEYNSSQSSVDIVNYTYGYDKNKINPVVYNQQKLQKLKSKKDLMIFVSQRLKHKLPISNVDSKRYNFFSDPLSISQQIPVSSIKPLSSSMGNLIISDDNYQDFLQQSNMLPQTYFIYVHNNKMPLLMDSNIKNQNTIIMSQQQVNGLIQQLQQENRKNKVVRNNVLNEKNNVNNNNNNNINNNMNNNNNDNDDMQLSLKSIIDQYQKVRIVYDQTISPQQKRKILSTLYKYKNITPIKFQSIQSLTQIIKQPNSLLMLMINKQLPNLDKQVNKQNYKIIKNKNKKMRMIIPKNNNNLNGLDTIFQENNQYQNQYTNIIKDLTDQQVDLVLGLIENKPEDDREDILEYEKSKIKDNNNNMNNMNNLNNNLNNNNNHINNQDNILQQDQITKLNVHSNIRVQDIKLFGNQQIDRIKQRLDGNMIVLVVQHSKKQQVKQLTNKYNILLQIYTNALNLQNDLRDRKDSVTIAVVNKKMIDKIVPLKQKYKQVTFILQCDTPQEELLEKYKPYISGQVRKMGDLEKVVAELVGENQKIRYNDHNMKLASRYENKRPSVSVVDHSNNQRFANAINNQISKRVFLFYKQPDNSHIKLKLKNQLQNDNISFIPYKNILTLKSALQKHNNFTSIVIANGQQIQQIQNLISKKKQNIFVIRYNPPEDIKDIARVKRLFSTYKKNDLQDYLYNEFMKINNNNNKSKYYERNQYKSKSPTNNGTYGSSNNVQIKKYTQKYQPNAFGTTPRFAGDFVPPKSMKETYSNKYMKSQSRSKVIKDESPKSRNIYYKS